MKISFVPSLRDVARRAGVSVMTASRAFRAGVYIRPETRDKVHLAATELGYRPDARLNELMGHLRGGRKSQYTSTIGLIRGVTEQWPEFPKTPTNKMLIDSLESRAESLGYGIDNFIYPFDKDVGARLRRTLRARGIQGLIILPPPGSNFDLKFDFTGFSVVVAGNVINHPRIHRVMGNERSAIRLALEKVLARGYRRPGLVMHRLADEYSEHAWLPEYLSAQWQLPQASRIPPCIYPEWTPHAPEILLKWFEKWHPDVVLATDGDVKRWLDTEGITSPRDYGFVCLCLEAVPANDGMAGVLQNFNAMGELLVEQLVGLLQRGQTGVPDKAMDCFIEATWMEGDTLPSRDVGRESRQRNVRQLARVP